MYHWVLFVHILSAFVFALAHGASTKVILKLRSEKDPERLAVLLDLSADYMNVLYGSLLVMILAGIGGGFIGKWWGSGWIWTGIVLLLGIASAMYSMATLPMSKLRKALGPAVHERPEDLEARRAVIRPVLIAAIGYGGLAVIVWLMVFKPF